MRNIILFFLLAFSFFINASNIEPKKSSQESCNELSRYARSIKEENSTLKFTGYRTKGSACARSGGSQYYVVPVDDITEKVDHVCSNGNVVKEIKYTTLCG